MPVAIAAGFLCSQLLYLCSTFVASLSCTVDSLIIKSDSRFQTQFLIFTLHSNCMKFFKNLYTQVIIAILIGIALGVWFPSFAQQLKPLGDAFIKLIKMMIAPIIFCTIVHGIASMGDMKQVGRVGLKALIYFEGVTTLALIVGLIVVNVMQPGAGMNTDTRTIDTKS